MAVVFFIILFFILIILAIICSTIKINVQRLKFSNGERKNLQYDYLIFLELLFLNRIKIMKLTLTPQKLKALSEKVKINEKKQKINVKDIKKDLPDKSEVKELGKKLNVRLEAFHFHLEIGTKDVIITSAIVAVFASIIGILLPKWVRRYCEEKYQYKIIPIYQNQNVIKLSLNCIIQVKVIHIINIIFTFVKKRKESKKNERTSNRRSYDYSYEQY